MYSKIKKIPKSRSNVHKFPETPGVYFFWQNNKPIYIGKAINLKRRALSYFSKSIFGKTKSMVLSASEISYLRTQSDLEAVLLESLLVRKHQPKFNSELKDDKSPLYIQITREEFPRVIAMRKPRLEEKNIFGPFPDARKVKEVMKTLRRIFPYATHRITKKPCLYSQMNLCNPCPSYIKGLKDEQLKKTLTKEYHENIRLLKGVLSGRIKFVKKILEKMMLELAQKEGFEKAATIRNRINLLDYITNPRPNIEEYLKNPNFYEDIRKKEIAELKRLLNRYFDIKKIIRVECYDVSHFSGFGQAASMVTFIDGEPDKSYYRHFHIRSSKKSSDTTSLHEVAKRRIRHFDDWGKPDLVIVDGGKPQVAVFFKNLHHYKIPVVGLAKRLETLVVYNSNIYTEIILPEGYARNYLQRIRNEAHRFAQEYHKLLFSKSLMT